MQIYSRVKDITMNAPNGDANSEIGAFRSIWHNCNFLGCQLKPMGEPITDQAVSSKRKTLWVAIALLSCFLSIEWIIGLQSQSLSLQADAGHILSDVTALGLTLIASWLARRPAEGRATFGYRRVEVLASLINGLSLVAVAVFIGWEAWSRFWVPTPVIGMPMLIVAAISLVINALNIKLLHGHSHDDLNMRGAFLHVVADTVSSVGITVAALAVHFLHWFWMDVAVSAVVAVWIGVNALPLVRDSLEVLLNYAPRSIDTAQIEATLRSYPAVAAVENLHVWSVTSGEVALSAHLIVESLSISLSAQERDRLIAAIQTDLAQSFGIHAVTLQIVCRSNIGSLTVTPLFSQSI